MRACMSYMLCSRALSRDSTGSGMGSTGAPAGGPDGTLGVEKESRWMSACLEARRLISRSPTKSPRLKLPLPCLNSHKGESGDPVWNTSLTAPSVNAAQRRMMAMAIHSIPLWKPYMFNWRTNEEMLVCLKYDLRARLDRLKEVKAPDLRTTELWKTRLKGT